MRRRERGICSDGDQSEPNPPHRCNDSLPGVTLLIPLPKTFRPARPFHASQPQRLAPPTPRAHGKLPHSIQLTQSSIVFTLRGVSRSVEPNRSVDKSLLLQTEREYRELQRILSKASMANKTVIITTLNEAWAARDTMIDLFLLSFRRGRNIEHLLQHLVIVTLDRKAHERCLELHPYCFRLQTEGVDFAGEKKFMSQDYLKMMWRRIKFLSDVLEMGYSFVFSVSLSLILFTVHDDVVKAVVPIYICGLYHL